MLEARGLEELVRGEPWRLVDADGFCAANTQNEDGTDADEVTSCRPKPCGDREFTRHGKTLLGEGDCRHPAGWTSRTNSEHSTRMLRKHGPNGMIEPFPHGCR
jgi:hypothetical protein